MQVSQPRWSKGLKTDHTAERSQNQWETVLLFCSNIFFSYFSSDFLCLPPPRSQLMVLVVSRPVRRSQLWARARRGGSLSRRPTFVEVEEQFFYVFDSEGHFDLSLGDKWTFCTRNEQLREARQLLMGSPAVDRLKTEVGFVSVCYDFSFNSWTVLNQTLSFCRMFTRQRESVLDSIRSRPSICLSQIALGSPACLIFERFLSFWQIREVL